MEKKTADKHLMSAPTVDMNPSQEIQRAREMAAVLQNVVRHAALSVKIDGEPKEYLRYEAWQTIGRFFGAAVHIDWSRPIVHKDKILGWEAKASVVDLHGRTIASAESMCAKDERRWRDALAYAARGMAQTRASAKALRQAFAWVAVLAGYAPTPVEEMDDALEPEVAQNEPQSSQNNGGSEITQEQKRAIWELLKQAGFDKSRAADFVRFFSNDGDALSGDVAQSIIDDFDTALDYYNNSSSNQ